MGMRPARWLRGGGVASLLTVALAGCGLGSVTTTPTQAAPTATPMPPLARVKVPYLTGISMVAPDDGFIVGYDGYFKGTSFLLRLKGGEWSREELPGVAPSTDPSKRYIPLGVKMLSAEEGWIWGGYGDNPTILTPGALIHRTGRLESGSLANRHGGATPRRRGGGCRRMGAGL